MARRPRPSLAVPNPAKIGKVLQCCHLRRYDFPNVSFPTEHAISHISIIISLHVTWHQTVNKYKSAIWLSLQARVKAIAEIVGALVSGVKSGSDVDLNNVKREVRYLKAEYPTLVTTDKCMT